MTLPPWGIAAAGLALAGPPSPPVTPPAALPYAVAEGQPDPLVTALAEELDRLWPRLAAAPEPAHWVAIGVVDEASVRLVATHGAAAAPQIERSRRGDVDVRVGSPELDNTHKLRDAGWFDEEARFGLQLPITDGGARPLRLALWRALDDTYREAARRLIKVRTNSQVKVAREDQSADFSPAPAVVHLGAVRPVDLQPPGWTARLQGASARFLSWPEVHDSNVELYIYDEVHYLLTSEGTRVRQQRSRARLSIWASTTAEDGQQLSLYHAHEADPARPLPDEAELSRIVDELAGRLTELRRAPLVDPYVGPAILRGRAAGVFFHEILGHRAEGHRQKDEDEGQTLTDKVGQAVFPAFISVVDDPTVPHLHGADLAGHYRYDDEGVPAEPVTIIQDGVLKGFLMSRAPIAGQGRSNGHGRRQTGNAVVARQGNLIVTATQTRSYDQLRAELLQMVRDQGKPFGLIFDDISGGFTLTGRGTPNSYAVQPVTVWRVWADGRPDELVRGVDLIGTPLVTFSRITAASDAPQVFNGVCGAESGWVPVSAVAPDLLVSEVEVQRREKQNDRPPLLPPPSAGPGPAEGARP